MAAGRAGARRPRRFPGESVPDRFARQFDEALQDAKPNDARTLVYKARKRLVREADAPWVADLTTRVEAAEQRLRDLKRQVRQEKAERAAKLTKALAKPVRCTGCLKPFTRKKPQQRLCPSCRPPEQRSVRTVSGGLPTLGKRR